MQSIFMAMYRIASDPEDPKTVHVADGHYSPSLNNQLFPIPIKSYTSLVGESRGERYWMRKDFALMCSYQLIVRNGCCTILLYRMPKKE
jgi:hypothetical protein